MCITTVGLLLSFLPVAGQEEAVTALVRDSAQASWSASDPLRSDLLPFLPPVSHALHGAEHLSHFLPRFRDALLGRRHAGDAPLHMAHFGGSHVQAGRIGWSFRQRLMEDCPGLTVTRGVIAPHRLVGENGPPNTGWHSDQTWEGQRSANRRHRGQWGLTGLEATCREPGAVEVWSGRPAGSVCIDSVHVLTRPGETAAWRVDSASLTSDTVLLHPLGSGEAHLHGVWMVPRGADLVYHDFGGNGASSAAWLRHADFVSPLAAIGPDLAILAWGINDAHMPPERFQSGRFKQRYRALIDSIRQAAPEVDILLVTNNDSHYRGRHNPNAAAVRQAMLDLSEDKQVACWDLYTALGGAHSVDRLRRAGLASSDHLHFHRSGYILIGELLYLALSRSALSLPEQP